MLKNYMKEGQKLPLFGVGPYIVYGMAMVMSDMGGASTFVREYTLASDGPYCDCGYKKKS